MEGSVWWASRRHVIAHFGDQAPWVQPIALSRDFVIWVQIVESLDGQSRHKVRWLICQQNGGYRRGRFWRGEFRFPARQIRTIREAERDEEET
jgi:hypothetical protein